MLPHLAAVIRPRDPSCPKATQTATDVSRWLPSRVHFAIDRIVKERAKLPDPIEVADSLPLRSDSVSAARAIPLLRCVVLPGSLAARQRWQSLSSVRTRMITPFANRV